VTRGHRSHDPEIQKRKQITESRICQRHISKPDVSQGIRSTSIGEGVENGCNGYKVHVGVVGDEVFGSFAEVESDGECKEEGEGCGGGGLIGCEPSFLGCACLTHCVFFSSVILVIPKR